MSWVELRGAAIQGQLKSSISSEKINVAHVTRQATRHGTTSDLLGSQTQHGTTPTQQGYRQTCCCCLSKLLCSLFPRFSPFLCLSLPPLVLFLHFVPSFLPLALFCTFLRVPTVAVFHVPLSRTALSPRHAQHNILHVKFLLRILRNC